MNRSAHHHFNPWHALVVVCLGQFMVILDATISPTGCVSGISLIAGVDTPLDLAALDAVSGWAYTPTLLDGQPVPVAMTVTVNFRIN